MNNDMKQIQINFKLEAQNNGRLTLEELKFLPVEKLTELHDSVSAYLKLIESVKMPCRPSPLKFSGIFYFGIPRGTRTPICRLGGDCSILLSYGYVYGYL